MDDKLMQEAGIVAGILNMTTNEYIEGLVKQDLYNYRNEKGEVDPKPLSDGSYLIKECTMFGRPYLQIVKDGQGMKIPKE